MEQRFHQIIHSYIPTGLVLWLLLWIFPWYKETERLLLFSVLVIVPLVVFRVIQSIHINFNQKNWILSFIVLHPIGALTLAGSMAISPGILSGILSIPWGLVTLFIASWGFFLLVKLPFSLGDFSKSLGFMYIVVGGIWLVGHQFDGSLIGFKGQIMILTANHFHYAGFVVPVLFGYFHHYIGKSYTRIVILFGGLSPILIALGMTYSSELELVSVIIFAATLFIYSIVVFLKVVPNVTRWTKALQILSSSLIWITMGLAMIYAWGEWTGQAIISIPTMVHFHAWGNALGFSFLGILAWHTTITDQRSENIPFSKIQGSGKIGATFIASMVESENSAKRPTGLSDSFSDYEDHEFKPGKLHPDIIHFYEHTKDYEIRLFPKWSRGFRLPSKLYKEISQRLEQMNFPIEAESREQQVDSEILPIDDKIDGRKDVRAWVRTYSDTKKAIYTALYSTHINEGVQYMNIAFPLPFSQMTSVLHLRNGEGSSVVLTSWRSESGIGDQGVYVVLLEKAIHFPINETIRVWKEPGSSEGNIRAKHDMWLFGIKFLVLDYEIYKK